MAAALPDTVLFFDASCLVAAAGSPSGGSWFLLSLCRRGFLSGALSQAVRLEAERNILDKLPELAWSRYQLLMAQTPLTVVPLPSPAQLRRWHDAVGEKDAHVLAAALAAEAAYLLTLDRPLIARVGQATQALVALTPAPSSPRSYQPTP